MKAMLLAAGLGTRLKPWTDKHPKALAIVNGKTLLQRNIEYLLRYGFNEIVINVHHFADQIINEIENNNGYEAKIFISDETKEVLETGGGLLKAEPLLKDTTHFLLMNVDILTDVNLEDFLQKHQQSKNIATLAVSSRASSRYLLFDEKDKLCGWENIKTQQVKMSRNVDKVFPKAFSGMHFISSKVFSLIGQRGKFSMIDTYLDLASTYPIGFFDHSGNKFIDVGKPESIEKAEKLFS